MLLVAPFTEYLGCVAVRPEDEVFNIQRLEDVPAELLYDDIQDNLVDDFMLDFDYNNIDYNEVLNMYQMTDDYPFVVFEHNHLIFKRQYTVHSFSQTPDVYCWKNYHFCCACFHRQDHLHCRSFNEFLQKVNTDSDIHKSYFYGTASTHDVFDPDNVCVQVMDPDNYCFDCNRQLFEWYSDTDCRLCTVRRNLFQ